MLEEKISCPYCGESSTVLVDPSDIGQEYIEDCYVCCRPIYFEIFPGVDESVTVAVRSENDT